MEKKYYTTAETARILGKNQTTILRWLKKGKMKGEKVKTRGSDMFKYVICEDVVNTFLDEDGVKDNKIKGKTMYEIAPRNDVELIKDYTEQFEYILDDVLELANKECLKHDPNIDLINKCVDTATKLYQSIKM